MAKRKLPRLGKIASTSPDCVECGKLGKLVSGAAIYPQRPDLHGKAFYLCECGAYVGCHDGTAMPLGKPAGPATRRARMAAHDAFDPLWRRKAASTDRAHGKARVKAYKWLAEQLGTPSGETHIGWMTEAEARQVVEICAPYSRRAA